MEFEIRIEGAEEVAAMLSGLPRLVVAAGFLAALKAGIQPIVEELEARTPRRKDGERSEDDKPLEESIVTDFALSSNYDGGTAAVGFGKEGYRANFVEYGHRMVGHKPEKAELGYIEPQPFMRPAAVIAAPDAINRFADTLLETLKSAQVIDDVA